MKRFTPRSPASSRFSQLAFTLVELLVVIAIIAILASLLLPSLARAKGKAFDIKCVNNLKQLGAAVFMYADDHEGRLPSAEMWPSRGPIEATNPFPPICFVLSNYVSGAMQVFECPLDRYDWFKNEGSSYEWNYDMNNKLIESPRGESRRFGSSIGTDKIRLMYDYENFHGRNTGTNGRMNVLYADGHVAPF